MKNKSILTSAVGAAMIFVLTAGQSHANDLRERIASDYDTNLRSLFTYFHENPELSFKEEKTAQRLGAELESLGFEVAQGIGRTGVVAVMKNGDGPTILLRADMDGLPVLEDTGLSYASKARQIDIDGVEKPVMHACGHDVHMTSLVGAGRQLSENKDRWSGTLILIGQPAEERISGAREMMEDGLYKKFPKPDYALAFHVSAEAPTGKIVVPLGAAYSSSDSVDIYVKGVGAHGASPHRGIDPVLTAAKIVVGLQTIASRTLSPREPGVITVGAIHGGTKHNIIGDKVHLQLTVRSDNPKTREKLKSGIERVVRGEAIAMGVPKKLMPEIVWSKTETTPVTANDRETAQYLRDIFSKTLPADTVMDVPRTGMGAEDFAYFVTPESGVKGVYFGVGGTPKKDLKTVASHHSPFFKIEPEESVTLGTEAMVVAAMSLFEKGK